MAASALTACVCAQLLLLLPAASGFQSEDRVCAFTNHPLDSEPNSGPANELRGVVQENGTVLCSPGSRCYGLWEKRGDGEASLVQQGCWTHIGDPQECHSDRCLVTATPSQIQNGSYRFCCCSQNLCNANFTEAPPTADTPALRLMKYSRGEQQTDQQALRREVTALIALVTVAIAAILIVALFLVYRMMKGKHKLALSALDNMEAANRESAVDLDDLKLLELIGRGRYGTVYRGCLNERCMAVKLFSSANRQNFNTERSIYALPLLQQHDNVARFLAANERTTADGGQEFLILLEYYPYGSLSRYLSAHTVDWSTCCRMTHGVTRGLAFLHTELCRGDQYKPAVAHRDVTSRNVLVRADLSCVLADFGLSMKLTGRCPGHQGEEDVTAISEVGTVRYMAPEVLSGALNLRDCEAALKQVDVYALGLLYWESFRRCRDLFPGAAVPEHQLAFQAELGNNPSFEEIQVLVVRERHRPLFPEAWKANSLVLHSLKETMEDCWDQDAEARLTAQCAEERLCELTMLSVHTTVNNHRNLASYHYFEDLQGDVVRNIQAEVNLNSIIKTKMSGPLVTEKNRNSLNYERQLAKARSSSSDGMTPAPMLSTISESGHLGGAVLKTPVCLQLTEPDLESVKLDPEEVDKNLGEKTDENLDLQKPFGSKPQTASLLNHHTLHSTEVNNLISPPTGELGGVARGARPPVTSVARRPTTLLLHAKTRETPASPQLKLIKLRSICREVETGVAKMNTVKVVTAAEPHMVTTVTNVTSEVGGSFNSGVPNLVKNCMIGGGRINLAGPQIEKEEDSREHLTLLHISPDEHEPLLRREQRPAESEPLHHQTGQGSNYNNNNNRTTLESHIKIQGLEGKPQCIIGSEASLYGGVSNPKLEQHLGSLEIHGPFASNTEYMERKILLSDPVSQASDTGIHLQKPPSPDLTLGPRNVQSPKACVIHPIAQGYEGPHSQSRKIQTFLDVEASRTLDSQELEPGPETILLDLLVAQQNSSTTNMSNAEAAGAETNVFYPEPSPFKLPATESPPANNSETIALALAAAPERSRSGLQISAAFQKADLVPSDEGYTHIKRPKRPCSLDLSSSYISTDDPPPSDNSRLSTSGEKIKRRVKTPYTLKKLRPASWILSTDMVMNSDSCFSTSGSSSSQAQLSSGLQRAGGFGLTTISQSKSSMAVFLLGSGATATTTSEPDGLTCF